jgi:hypothetical protein
MTAFKAIDAAAYFKSNSVEAKLYRKDVVVFARPAEEGEEIITITHGGHEETRNVATHDQTVIRNPGGEEYIIGNAKFSSRYIEEEGDAPTGYRRYRAVGGPVSCITLKENVAFRAPWGEEMRIQEGGVLVCAGEGDVYGIQPVEFRNTYRQCDQNGEFV